MIKSRICVVLFCCLLILQNSSANNNARLGTCFLNQLESGNCIGLIAESVSKSVCCGRAGFYLNRAITEQEYLNNHLLFEIGTPNCVRACDEDIPATCENYICPEGHHCRLVKNEPKCLCNVTCNESDYLSQSICTTNLRKFQNMCQFKQARCATPNQGLETIRCPQEGQACPKLVNQNLYKNHKSIKLYLPFLTHEIEVQEEQEQEEDDDDDQFWNNLKSLIGANQIGVFTMQRRLFRKFEAGLKSGSGTGVGGGLIRMPIATSRSLDEVQCPPGQYCVVRQSDGQSACAGWDRQSWDQLNMNCPDQMFDQPICATDNQTYQNGCELKLASLRRQIELRIAYKGVCSEQVNCANVKCTNSGMKCLRHHNTGQPVCLDCAHLPLDCNASYQNGIGDIVKGIQTAASSNDPYKQVTEWPVVCGSDGRTYRNACFLQIVNCLSDKFVEITSPTFCKEKIPSTLNN